MHIRGKSGQRRQGILTPALSTALTTGDRAEPASPGQHRPCCVQCTRLAHGWDLAGLPWPGQGCWQPCKTREQAYRSTRLHRTLHESNVNCNRVTATPLHIVPDACRLLQSQPDWGSCLERGLTATRWARSQWW